MKPGKQDLRDYIKARLASVTVLAALGAALDRQGEGPPKDPELRERVDEILCAAGLADIVKHTSPADAKQIVAEIRFNMLLDANFLSRPIGSFGWRDSDLEILRAGGTLSAGFADALAHEILPRLDGILQRLESPEASFLDVGVGVAGLSVAMAQRWPSLNVVGIDPWMQALSVAREAVQRAGLADRIQLREQAAEDLSDQNAFDLAWLPTAFLPSRVIPTACQRLRQALVPGSSPRQPNLSNYSLEADQQRLHWRLSPFSPLRTDAAENAQKRMIAGKYLASAFSSGCMQLVGC